MITRRRFLQGIAGITAAVSAKTGLMKSANSTQKKDRKLGVALVGLGRYATGQLGPALRLTKNCELVSVVTGTPAKADAWAAEYKLDPKNIYNYETMDRIAANPAIDIAYVVTPPALHADYVIRAAKAGKHVISEKPMATSIADCDRMIAACKKAKVQLGIGYRLQYDPYHRELVRAARAGEFGKLGGMSGGFGYTMRQREMRITKSLSGGGPLMDVGIYVIHAACAVTNSNPTYVTAKEEPKTDPELFNEVEEAIDFTLEFPGGERCEGLATFNRGANRFRVDGDRCWMEIAPAFNYNGLAAKNSAGPIVYPPTNQQAAQMDDFAECVLTGRKTTVPGELGRRDLSILLAIYEAARTGKRIKVSY
jgi:glucose-fructose oxidoreductase